MVRILTICRHCGDIEVTLDDIRVRVWTGTDRGEYTLRCPDCAAATVWPASPETIDVLAASGATMESAAAGSRRGSPHDRDGRSRPRLAPNDARRTRGHKPRHRPST